MRLAYPGMVRLPLPETGRPPAFDHPETALAWLQVELPGLETAIEHAARHGPRRRAWELADQLRGFFFLRRETLPWMATGKAGLAAAEQQEDPQAQTAMHLTLGQAHWSAGGHAQALHHYRTAQELAERAGWHLANAYLWRGIGLVQGRTRPARRGGAIVFALPRNHRGTRLRLRTGRDAQ